MIGILIRNIFFTKIVLNLHLQYFYYIDNNNNFYTTNSEI